MSVSPLAGKPAPAAMLVNVAKLLRQSIWSVTAKPPGRSAVSTPPIPVCRNGTTALKKAGTL
jgi:hypothetical protein